MRVDVDEEVKCQWVVRVGVVRTRELAHLRCMHMHMHMHMSHVHAHAHAHVHVHVHVHVHHVHVHVHVPYTSAPPRPQEGVAAVSSLTCTHT